MTIAPCYVSAEGVVLGADSTATMSSPARHRIQVELRTSSSVLALRSGWSVKFIFLPW